jgi:hypothetical protein
MLLVTSDNAPRIARGNKKDEAEAKLKGWVADQLANAIYVRDNDLSPGNYERQLGQKMFSTDLEKRLKKLNPDLIFEDNPYNPTKKALYVARRGAGKVYVCAYERGIMPERSVMRVKEEVTRDYSVQKLDRKDLPKHEVTANGIKFEDDALLPGFKKTLIPYGEAIRGWRTVAVKIVEQKLNTPAEIENIFGRDDTANWANHMGHQRIALPW